MNYVGIIIAATVVGGSGLLIGLFLGIFGEKFKVETDEKEVAVREQLPGNNCGGCGYAGCDGLAAAIAKGEAPVNGCPVGGEPVAVAIGAIMGVSADNTTRKTAFVKCGGDCGKAKEVYDYYGNEDCEAMVFVPNQGSKGCTYGCLGYGTCVKACPFDAIHIMDGIAVVDKDKCKACGRCVAVCPRNLIELVPYDAKILVKCNSKDSGKDVMKNCSAGCIGCQLCVKNCPVSAMEFDNHLVHIDMDKCVQCGACADKCPKQVITGKESVRA